MWGGSDNDYSFDSGNEWLVTNITHELSAGLETSPLLAETIFDYGIAKQELVDDDYTPLYSCDFVNECVKTEMRDEMDLYEEHSKRYQSSNSGSETSSVDAWAGKAELDTPPTTPPNPGLSPETICVISGGDVTFLPIAVNRLTKAKCVGSKSRVKNIAAKDMDFSKGEDGQCGDLSATTLDRCAMSKEDLQKQQARRRQERMIRNRESAYLSRKRAKEHVSLLENQVQGLTQENHKLKQENADLKERLGRYEPVRDRQPWRRLPDLPRKTTALLALALTVCINLTSLSLFDDGPGGATDLNVPPSLSEHHSRSLLWVGPLDEASLSNLSTSCPVAINQSESMRLERELREWIVGGGDSEGAAPTPLPPNGANRTTSGRKKRIPRARRPREFALDVWGVRAPLLGLEGLYEAIHRRPDTFYLVSFSADHLLLPAMARNETSRPKMSVMLPAFLANTSSRGGGHVEMMQIDCEVTNTQLLSLGGHHIPSHLRTAPKFSNDSVKARAGAGADAKELPPFLADDAANFVMNLSKRRRDRPLPAGNSSLAAIVSAPALVDVAVGAKSAAPAPMKEAVVPKRNQSSRRGAGSGGVAQIPNGTSFSSFSQWQANHLGFRPIGN